MALKYGLPLTSVELLKHLVEHDPTYKPHLEKLLAPLGWDLNTYYEHIQAWDFHKLGLDKKVVSALREENFRPNSLLLGPAEERSLVLMMDSQEKEYLAFHVLGSEDGTLTQEELVGWHTYVMDLFRAAKLPVEKLVWFWSDD